MAKTESTAVNDLIKIATTQTPLANDPSDDLMFTIPPKGRDRSTKMVAPLPPMRVPHGTQEHAIAMPAIKAGGSPAKGTATVPPLPQIARTRTPLPPPLPSSRPSIPVPPIATVAPLPPTAPSLPAPPIAPSIPAPPIAVAPVAAPEFLTDSIDPAEPIATRTTRPSLPPPSRPALPSEYPVVSAVHSLPMAPAAPWADDDNSIDIDASQFRGDSTAQVARPRTNLEWVIKLAPWMGVMVAIGVAVGAYIVIDSKSSTAKAAAPSVEVVAEAEPVAPATGDSPAVASPAIAAAAAAAPSETATPPADEPEAVTPPNLAATAEEPKAVTPPNLAAPAQPSIVAPAPTAGAIAKRPVFVDVRIDSAPTGATVTLVDRGKRTFLGTTPISTAVDPSRTYQVVFEHARRPTQSAQLDPKASTRLAVTLGRSGTPKTEVAMPAVKTAKVAKPAKSAKLVEPAWDAPAAKIEKSVTPAPAAEAPVAEKAEKAVGGNGVLMISSKPPCEIHIDGKATGLMTPQRSLPLSAGKHKIMLVNAAEKIKKTFTVDITANETSKVIQNLMQ